MFSPKSWLGLPLMWSTISIILLVVYPDFWLSCGRREALKTTDKPNFVSELKANLNTRWLRYTWMYLSLHFVICCLNFFSLFPYVFTVTAHLVFTLSMALPAWMGVMILGSYFTPEKTLAHLVPSGAPFGLGFFMVLVEFVSTVIRPITLGVRLAANMTAGHILLALIASPGWSGGLVIFPFILSGICVLLMLETGVCVIQGYVFALLQSMYAGEVDLNEISAEVTTGLYYVPYNPEIQ